MRDSSDSLPSLILPPHTVIYQSTQYDADTLTMRGGGMIALLKAQATGPSLLAWHATFY